ncbi:protein SZT2-like protein, partial [Leptotrombidium deliense]
MSATKTRSKEAEHVFVLMTNEHRVSRNIRANWYFEHLNTCVSLKPKHRLCEFTEEVEIVSVVARDDGEADQQIDDTEEHTYLITANTKVTFLARRYRFVFILDLSPSVSSVDVLSNSVLYEKIFLTFSRSLRGLCSHAYVPGSKIIFEPEICVTVLAHTPFYTSEGQQVLAQGWKINSENVELLLSFVHQRLKEVTLSVAEVTASASEFNSNDTDIYISSLFEDIDARLDLNSAKTMTTPDVSIVNMFRYGLLALQLLPEQSNTGIVMITDGMFGLPNASVLEILLTQLRNNTIACSFLQIGSNPSPFSCIGYVPYTEIMKFLSTATFGAYLPHCPKIHQASVENKEFNLYHRAFLAWSFQRGVSGFQFDETFCKANEWFKDNPYFYYGKQKFDENNEMEMKENERVIFQAKDQQLIRHKQFQSEICAKFTDLLSCRLREGYTIKEVKFSKGEAQITVTLVLPFQYNCSMEYVISAAWTPNHKISENSELNELTECHYEITVESNYNFLHDVTCQVKKPIKSPYRNDAVRRYWSTLKSLSDSDKFLVHLNKFAQSAGATVPESIRSKIPLFYLPPNSSYPVLTSKTSQSAFAQYWKQICLLDVNMWQKWMHTHRIKLILQHDTPLPKYLHLPSANGRYAHIQCRQALQEVNTLLNNYSSFVMVENHSYIKLIQNVETDAPESFFIIRVITYLPLPYMVIYLAFVGGFSGAESQKIVDELKEMLKNCKFRKRNVKSQKSSLHISVSSDEKKASVDHDWVDVNACFLIRKPVEKILIKYERTPSNYLCSFDRQISSVQNNSERSLEQINMLTLSKYLHHHRWVWVSQQGPKSKLAATSMSKILSTLLKVRLQEGFKFAHNNNGIINVVSELRMEDNCPENTPCVVQYVLFPPHTNTVISDNCVDNEEMETVEADGEWQLITECWIEPQVGKVYGITECCDRFEQLTFHEITQSFFDVDEKIISTLLTYEHIALMCNNQSVPAFSPFVRSESAFRDCQMLPSNTSPIHDTHKGFPHKEINLTVVPFCFKIVNLLTKCQQAQVTFSTLISNVDFSANYDSSKNIANTKFIDEILTNLVKTNDREIYFTMEDNCSFLQFVREKLNENLFPLNDSDEFISSEGCPKWRCFAKALPSNQLVLTVIPSSFQDLIRLLTVSYSLSIDEIPEKSICYFDQSGDETIDMSENVRYCSLTFPVFVYKCGLSSLTKQLALNAYQKEEDLYIDCRHNELACEAIKKPRSFVPGQLDAGNICLNSICDAVSSTVWMSLTKVVFDTLQIGLSVDKRDIDFVLDSICEKTSIEIDIWPFLRSICGHLNDYCQGMYQFFEERNRTQNSQNQSGKPALSPSEKKFPLDLLKRHH